jgi:hypothetical protein
VAVYGAMFGATVGGQLVGIVLDALLLGRRALWVPLGCSVVLEAWVGARFGGRRVSKPLTWSEWGRASAYYSGCLLALSLPLAAWTIAYNRGLVGAASSRDVAMALGVVLSWLVAATLLRHALMILFASRGRA